VLQITVPKREFFDEATQCFVECEAITLQLEHSLVSMAKWESRWHKPFLVNLEKRTPDENNDYLRCMTLTKNVPETAYLYWSSELTKKVETYISDPMTATTITEPPGTKKGQKEIMTAEVIYYYMTALTIPFECQKWHLNRLLTLIRVCSIKSQPPKKMGKREVLSRNAALNQSRRAQNNTKG